MQELEPKLKSEPVFLHRMNTVTVVEMGGYVVTFWNLRAVPHFLFAFLLSSWSPFVGRTITSLPTLGP